MSSALEGQSKTVDVVLAEFVALRAEVTQHLAARFTVIGLNVTGVAAIGGIVIANRADTRLLLLLPFLSGALGLWFHILTIDVMVIASYVENVQRPILVEQLGEDRLFQYEHYFRSRMKGRRLIQAITAGLMFPAVSLAALTMTIGSLHSLFDWSVWILGVVLLLLQNAVWATRLRRQPAPD
ncbi:hypothetical protein [Phytohabitans rumicis]|uniref:Uncharacterized protein n=1 Tax=Phytohabitans rumicis TaxID=1076125 RepID=A0A6V8LNI4_9ACTN|nr:hypothetical protein [Phytohabitans rumicis]GFJ96601.1 hypothetical protein Prum_102430 [Phytohabitans rumicis]